MCYIASSLFAFKRFNALCGIFGMIELSFDVVNIFNTSANSSSCPCHTIFLKDFDALSHKQFIGLGVTPITARDLILFYDF